VKATHPIHELERTRDETLTYFSLNAGDLARAAAKILGGGGGGRPTLAQAGGTDPTRVAEALQAVSQLVAGTLA
jgi:alanyl-tRNA synthetase